MSLPLTTFIGDLEKSSECTVVKFADDAVLGGPVDRLKDGAAIQSDPDRLEEWTDGNPVKFSKAGANSCIWEGITPCHSIGWELTDCRQFSRTGLGGY